MFCSVKRFKKVNSIGIDVKGRIRSVLWSVDVLILERVFIMYCFVVMFFSVMKMVCCCGGVRLGLEVLVIFYFFIMLRFDRLSLRVLVIFFFVINVLIVCFDVVVILWFLFWVLVFCFREVVSVDL